MHRRFGMLMAAVLATLMLAGCVVIPSSGGVHDGEIIDEQANPEFVVLPRGPVAGSSQEQILEDFMQAVRSPQNGYGIAQQFLTAGLRKTWKPDESALIRTDTPTILPGDTNVLTYEVTSRASVDDQGHYREERDAAPQTLTFRFAQENGEWRISEAANGIVLSQSSFAVAFREQSLYFFDPSYDYLVPDVRWFPSRGTSSVRAVQALLLGPTSWLGQAVNTAFPEATKLGDDTVTVASGTATVDLTTEVLASTAQQRDRMRQQLAATLGLQDIRLTAQGLDVPTPDSAGSHAVVNPIVESAPLIGAPGAFGPDGGSGIAPLAGLSGAVVAAGATAATLSSDKQTIAMLAPGGVYVASVGDASATLVDDRVGLAPPSIDPFRFVWSAESVSAASLRTFDVDGNPHELSSGLPGDAAIVSLEVSRDGTRLLVYLSTPVGPQLSVYGIVRDNNVPVRLGEPLELPVGAQAPADATWVDDHTVATISTTGVITALELGGPTVSLGQLDGATTIVGSNGGTDGLRVLTSAGELWRPQGSGWANTRIAASFLATRQ